MPQVNYNLNTFIYYLWSLFVVFVPILFNALSSLVSHCHWLASVPIGRCQWWQKAWLEWPFALANTVPLALCSIICQMTAHFVFVHSFNYRYQQTYGTNKRPARLKNIVSGQITTDTLHSSAQQVMHSKNKNCFQLVSKRLNISEHTDSQIVFFAKPYCLIPLGFRRWIAFISFFNRFIIISDIFVFNIVLKDYTNVLCLEPNYANPMTEWGQT